MIASTCRRSRPGALLPARPRALRQRRRPPLAVAGVGRRDRPCCGISPGRLSRRPQSGSRRRRSRPMAGCGAARGAVDARRGRWAAAGVGWPELLAAWPWAGWRRSAAASASPTSLWSSRGQAAGDVAGDVYVGGHRLRRAVAGRPRASPRSAWRCWRSPPLIVSARVCLVVVGVAGAGRLRRPHALLRLRRRRRSSMRQRRSSAAAPCSPPGRCSSLLVVWNVTLMKAGAGAPPSLSASRLRSADLGAAQARALHRWIGHPPSVPANRRLRPGQRRAARRLRPAGARTGCWPAATRRARSTSAARRAFVGAGLARSGAGRRHVVPLGHPLGDSSIVPLDHAADLVVAGRGAALPAAKGTAAAARPWSSTAYRMAR